MSEHVLVEVEPPVGRLTLNRPERLNAFYGAMRDEIATGLEALAGDPEVRVVIVTGAGRAFCAGADVNYMRELREREDVDGFMALVEAGRRVVTTVVGMPKPVIAAINGPAAGGGANLALACDLRIASERASIGQTFNRIGMHPDWGGTWIVPRLVGPGRAAELFFLAEMVDAVEAERIGLVNRVVPHDRLEAEVLDLARRLAEKPARSLALAKRAVLRSLGATLEEMLEYEEAAQRECFLSADALEGVRAFVEKRPPEFGSRSGTAGRAATLARSGGDDAAREDA